MDTGLNRVELTGHAGLAGLARLSGPGNGFWGRTDKAATKYFKSGFIWLPTVLIGGFGAWMLLSDSASNTAESEPVQFATVAATEPVQPPAINTGPKELPFNPATAEAVAPAQPAPVDGLKISSQSWRRGGLGSNALITFTLRNSNDYAVKDIQLFCSFARRDGSHLTDRTRTISDAVNMKSRKTFARMHVGFVNVNANKAKCSLVAASPV